MEFDTFYQYFIYSKNCAYIAIILILPIFALFWNFVLYPTKDPDVLSLCEKLKGICPRKACKKKD